jgi:transcription elongation GreA/GreB family factor
MPQPHAINLAGDEVRIFFPYNRENNYALRELTRATDLRWNSQRRAYCLSAAATNSPEVCHNLRGFASRRGLRFDKAASVLLGAFTTPSTRVRVDAEIHAIDRKLTTQRMPNPTADSEADRRDDLEARRDELKAILAWPVFPQRPAECDIASPGSRFRYQYDDGQVDNRIISAVDIDGYDRVSPFQPVGKALSTARIGDHASLGKGRGSLTILAITD